jgi:hypothetical protein
MRSSVPVLLGTAALALTACAVVPPSGPTLLATPPEGKDLGQFQTEDLNCRNYAFGQIGYTTPATGANQAAVGSAVAGTALGAAAGALLGAAGGAAGTGAAIGAGTGLLAGSAIGAGNAQTSSAGLQAHYDTAYAQCMASAGNRLAPPVATYAPYGGPYAYPYYPGSYPYYPGSYPYYGPYWGWGPRVSLGIGLGFGGHRHWHGRHFHGHGYGFRGGFRGGRR